MDCRTILRLNAVATKALLAPVLDEPSWPFQDILLGLETPAVIACGCAGGGGGGGTSLNGASRTAI